MFYSHASSILSFLYLSSQESIKEHFYNIYVAFVLNWKIVTLSMRKLDCIWLLMVNMSSEKLYNKRVWSEGCGQLACGKKVKYSSVSAPACYFDWLCVLLQSSTANARRMSSGFENSDG